MQAFITGATGFLGSHLAAALIEKDWQVSCLALPYTDLNDLDISKVKIYRGDLDSLKTTPSKTLKNVDIVFHVAGLTNAPTYQEYFKVNVMGTQSLLEACLKNCTRLKRFVYVSSLAASGPGNHDIPINEADTPRPVCYYGKSKLEAERLIMKHQDQLPVSIIRPAGVYGPGDNSFLSVLKIIKRGVVPILSSKCNKINFGFIRDIIRGIILAGERSEAEGEIFNMGGLNTTSEKFLKSLAKAAGCEKPKLLVIPSWLALAAGWTSDHTRFLGIKTGYLTSERARRLCSRNWSMNMEKVSKILGFAPQVSNEEGCAITLEWYKSQRWIE